MPSRRPLRDLADRLRAAGFTVDGVSARLGAEAVDALGRNATIPAQRVLATTDDELATLVRLLMLQQQVPTDAAARALGDLAPFLAGESKEVPVPLLVRTPTGVRAALDLRPYAVEGLVDGWVVSDLIPTLDGRNAPPRADFVLGISPASTTLAQLAIPGRVGRALDLGTGCGVQALQLAARADHVVATDLNPRALALAAMTAALNDIDLDLREGSLYEPVAAERFDVILTNPPYVMSPPSYERLVYREGSLRADDLVRQVVSGAATHLNPGGVLQVLANWAITDEPWPDRLAGWIRPTGCDALVLQRERLDPAEYVEIWLADAGLAGSPDYTRRYAEWLDYFTALGITGVGMGWIALYNTGRDDPDLRLEEWPHRVRQPVGAAFDDHPTAVTASRLPDAQLLAARWRLADDIVQETLGVPGAEDPEHVVLRSGTGFCRAQEVDTALGGVLGACDGDLPLGELVGAVADLLGADAAALAGDLLPRLRNVIADGMLRPA